MDEGQGRERKHTEHHTDHSQKAYNGIRGMLYRKELVPGQKVSCRDLADRLDMSLTPVIQAFKYMEYQGFIRHEPRRGYYLTPLSLEELEEIFELRELLEPALVPATVDRLTQDGKSRLKAALEAHFSAEREVYLQERLFKNVEFHLTLASLSHKATQVRILRNLFNLLLLKYGGNQASVETMDSVDEEHRMVFECVVAGDAHGAKDLLLRHVRNVKGQVLERFRKIMSEIEFPEF